MPGDPGAQNKTNMKSVPGSYSDCALHPLCLRASVSSCVNLEPGSRSGSAVLLSAAVTMFFSLHTVLQAAVWSLRRTVWFLPSEEPAKHAMCSGLRVLASAFTTVALSPSPLTGLLSSHPVPRPWSFLPLTTHFHRRSGTSSDAFSLVDALFRFLV